MPREVIKSRAERLRNAAAKHRARWLDSLIGSTLPILVETGEKGHGDNFAPVSVPGAPRGATGDLRVTGREGDHIVGAFA